MVNFVIKRSGAIEPYNRDKIKRSITIASTQANFDDEDIPWVVDEVLAEVDKFCGGTERVSTQELKKIILKKLHVIAPAVAVSWQRYKK